MAAASISSPVAGGSKLCGWLGESSGTVLDSELLVQVLGDQQDRTAYLQGLHAVMPSGGRYFVLCFRESQANS